MLLDADATGLPEATRSDLKILHGNASAWPHRSGIAVLLAPVCGNPVRRRLGVAVLETLLPTGVTLTVDGDPSLPAVAGDGDALERMVLNLLTNASAPLEAGGECRWSLRRAAGREIDPPSLDRVPPESSRVVSRAAVPFERVGVGGDHDRIPPAAVEPAVKPVEACRLSPAAV